MHLFERIALVAAVVAAATLTRAQVAQAQASSFDAPDVGARVRISRDGISPTTGTVLARASDSIVVGEQGGRRETVAMKDVTSLAISSGRTRNVVTATSLGLVAGTLVGVLAKQNGDRVTKHWATFKSTDPNNLYLQPALGDADVAYADTAHGNKAWIPIGVVAGAAGGTLVGYLWKERWRPAAIRRGDARVGFVPAENPRRVALALSARF
jgi:hypothetical protein